MTAHLPEPMPLADVLAHIIEPTYANVLPGRFRSIHATVLLLAIGLQESRFQHRQQIGGPARGFWQFEKGGGVRGVSNHPASRCFAHAASLLRDAVWLGNVLDETVTFDALREDDLLACAFARLLLFTDPAPLPILGDPAAAWGYYLRNWRPGKPHVKTWARHYAAALEAVGA